MFSTVLVLSLCSLSTALSLLSLCSLSTALSVLSHLLSMIMDFVSDVKDIDQLQHLVLSDIWQHSPALLEAVYYQYALIKDQPQNQSKVFTATPEFWQQVWDLYDPDNYTWEETPPPADQVAIPIQLPDDAAAAPVPLVDYSDSSDDEEGEDAQQQGGAHPLDHFFEVTEAMPQQVCRFGIVSVAFSLKFCNLDDSADLQVKLIFLMNYLVACSAFVPAAKQIMFLPFFLACCVFFGPVAKQIMPWPGSLLPKNCQSSNSRPSAVRYIPLPCWLFEFCPSKFSFYGVL